MRPAPLLQPRVVVRRDGGQRRDLVTAQARRPATLAGRQAHVSRLEPFPTAAQQVGKGGAVHASTLPRGGARIQGLPIPGSSRACRTAGITLLDTGDFYGHGHNELLLGRALRGRNRDHYQLSVKFGGLRDPDGTFLGFDGQDS